MTSGSRSAVEFTVDLVVGLLYCGEPHRQTLPRANVQTRLSGIGPGPRRWGDRATLPL